MAPKERHIPQNERLLDDERLQQVSHTMVFDSLSVNPRDTLLIQHDHHPDAVAQAKMMEVLANNIGAKCTLEAKSVLRDREMLANYDIDGIRREAEMRRERMTAATKVGIIRRSIGDQKLPLVDEEKIKLWRSLDNDIVDLRLKRRWLLTCQPTPYEAKLDGMTYARYSERYFDACNLPMEQVSKAHDYLIERYLDPAKQLQIYAGMPNDPWHTHLSMYVGNNTFASSLMGRNMPGSETFTAPTLDSVEGVFAVPNQIDFNGFIIPNLRVEFKHGKVMRFFTSSENGMKWLAKQFSIDEGAKHIGEIAFGTNSLLWEPSVNGMYVEKGAGSFHAAFGAAYPDGYDGKDVKLYNGNDSEVHVDVSRSTLPLFGGGRVVVDGQVIQENGFFLDPALNILNPPTYLQRGRIFKFPERRERQIFRR
ncbi:MAG: aminopeptidase [Patescibacteria group bacterium]